MRTPIRGIRLALLAAVLFGATIPLAKALLVGLRPQVLAGLLYLGSGAGLALLWYMRRRRSGIPAGEAPLTRHDVPALVGAIVSGGVLAPVLLMGGLAQTASATASLLLNLEGVFTAVIAWTVFRENVDRRILLGMVAIVAGGILLAWPGHVATSSAIGPLLIAAACLCWAVDNNVTQKISAADPVQIAGLKGLAAGSVNLAIGLSLGGVVATGTLLASALLLGFAGYGLSFVSYVLALRDLGTARTGAYFALAPFVGAVGGLLLFHEAVTARFLAAAGAMGLGLWLHLSERHGHRHHHAPVRHTHRHTHDAHHQHAHDANDPLDDPHVHAHEHGGLEHSHPHYPDIHHRHRHS